MINPLRRCGAHWSRTAAVALSIAVLAGCFRTDVPVEQADAAGNARSPETAAETAMAPRLSRPQSAGLKVCAEGAAPEDPTSPPDGLPEGMYMLCGKVRARTPDGERVAWPYTVLTDRPRLDLAHRQVLFVHHGGPGLPTDKLLEASFPELNYRKFVVVAWQGSTSSATRGACGPRGVAFGTDREGPDWAEQISGVAAECAQAPVRLPWTGSAFSAATELETTRRAIGADRIDLLTYSYGTAVAQAYLHRYGQHVRRAVLDGPLMLEAPWIRRREAVGRAIAASWKALATSCKPASCPEQVATLLESSTQYGRLRAAVLAAKATLGSSSATLTGTIVDQATLAALRDPSVRPEYFLSLNAALDGQGSDLFIFGQGTYFGLDRAVFYRTICSDIDHPGDISKYRAATPLLDTYLSELAPCAVATSHRAPALRSGSGVKLLIVASDLDPLTPWELVADGPWGQNATVCRTDHAGHTGSRIAKVRAAALRFLRTGSARCP